MSRRGYVRLIVSYLFDWIVVILFAAAGAALTYISGFHRPFSLTDDAIAFPLKDDIVSLPVVAAIAFAVPVVVIVALEFSAAVFRRDKKNVPKSERTLAAVWAINAGWLGLCAGLAVTLFVTAGLKDMIGKPRPDLLARCNANLTNVPGYVVGGYGMTLESEAAPFVTSAICQQPDRRLLDDGFAAFPSGHSSFTSAGMVYLTLWLCARWNISIPRRRTRQTGVRSSQQGASTADDIPAPPLWLVAIAITPIFVALFVCSSRYADFHHAGFDIIAGAIIGTVFGWAAFRLYHRPLRNSNDSPAWSPRPATNAFLLRSDHAVDHAQEGQLAETTGYEMNRFTAEQPERSFTGASHEPILRVSPQAGPANTYPPATSRNNY